MTDTIFRYSIKAIIIKDGKFLIEQVNQGRGEFYKLPGGGHHFGETIHGALHRELKEELGLEADIGTLLFIRDYLAKNHDMEFDDPNFQQTELMFLCHVKDFSTLAQGTEPDKNQVICWKTASELEQIKFFPRKLVPYLQDPDKLQTQTETIYLGDIN
ncbi:MAG: NUDIX domain-containing protein [Alphaproteobacteria bacterium]|nr:NUDIX domain-containing protein [Alphaproteobacteria bacterium]